MEFPFPVQVNLSLKEYCTFGIGGHAEYLIEISSPEMAQQALSFCSAKGLPYLILGKGSNSLIADNGFAGLVIVNKIDTLYTSPEGLFIAGAGYSFSRLGSFTARNGWGGLEFAAGIPAAVGGAVYMNAGANGGEAFDTLVHVDYVKENGALVRLNKQQIAHSYRHTIFQQERGIILAAAFQLSPSAEAKQKQLQIIERRKATQPLREKSAGCIFCNPCSGPAGALIEQAGLKGFAVGGAKVSEIHANFIVNTGKATAADVLQLIETVQTKVQEKFGVCLKSEVRQLGFN